MGAIMVGGTLTVVMDGVILIHFVVVHFIIILGDIMAGVMVTDTTIMDIILTILKNQTQILFKEGEQEQTLLL